MTDSELSHLIKMANQIADNLSRDDSAEVAAERIADHISRVWAASMKAKIIDYMKTDGAELKDASKLAVAQLDVPGN